jgi:predicted membrane protein (TIGR00267 family)
MWLKEVTRHEYRHAPSVSETPVIAAMFMGVFYLLGGFFTFAPYLFLSIDLAIPVTIAMTLIALFLVGVFKAKLTGSNIWRSGFEMFVVSTAAAGIGYGLGILVPMLFHATVAL